METVTEQEAKILSKIKEIFAANGVTDIDTIGITMFALLNMIQFETETHEWFLKLIEEAKK